MIFLFLVRRENLLTSLSIYLSFLFPPAYFYFLYLIFSPFSFFLYFLSLFSFRLSFLFFSFLCQNLIATTSNSFSLWLLFFFSFFFFFTLSVWEGIWLMCCSVTSWEASSNSNHAITFTFGLIPFRKVYALYIQPPLYIIIIMSRW